MTGWASSFVGLTRRLAGGMAALSVVLYRLAEAMEPRLAEPEPQPLTNPCPVCDLPVLVDVPFFSDAGRWRGACERCGTVVRIALVGPMDAYDRPTQWVLEVAE